MGIDIGRTTYGEDLGYSLEFSTKDEDYPLLMLNKDGGISEGMFLDLYLIFKYLKTKEVLLLPFLRECFGLIEEKCTKEEVATLFQKNYEIKKDEKSDTFRSMLGFLGKSRGSMLSLFLDNEEVYAPFNNQTKAEIREEVNKTIDEAIQEGTCSFVLRDSDMFNASPLLEILAGMQEDEEMRLSSEHEHLSELSLNSTEKVKKYVKSEEDIKMILQKIKNPNLKGELVVSFIGE